MKNDTNVCIVGDANSINNSPLTESDARMRLQQAAHILVTGAISAAMKQQAALQKPAKKSAKPLPSMMSENQTLAEISCKNKQNFSQKEACKQSLLDCTAEGKIAQTQ